MKALPHSTRIARGLTLGALALIAFPLAAHAALTPQNARATPTAAAAAGRHGQVKFSSAGEQIVGEIVITQSGDNFHAEITKGPGVPLLTLTAKFGIDPKLKDAAERQLLSVRATGPLAHGGWTWRPRDLSKKKNTTAKLRDPSRVWSALPEVFMWGEAQAKGGSFRVTLPDIVMHARADQGELQRFDFARHQNPTGEPLPLRDLRKQPTLETVICHLD